MPAHHHSGMQHRRALVHSQAAKQPGAASSLRRPTRPPWMDGWTAPTAHHQRLVRGRRHGDHDGDSQCDRLSKIGARHATRLRKTKPVVPTVECGDEVALIIHFVP